MGKKCHLRSGVEGPGATPPQRALLRFDHAEIQDSVGSGTLVGARLHLTVTSGSWGPAGSVVSIHRLLDEWSELGATWNCANDIHTGNGQPDCDGTDWAMNGPDAPWVATPTDTAFVVNQQDSVTFDVTADITVFLASQAQDYGWMIRKEEEATQGSMQVRSRYVSIQPRLELEVIP